MGLEVLAGKVSRGGYLCKFLVADRCVFIV